MNTKHTKGPWKRIQLDGFTYINPERETGEYALIAKITGHPYEHNEVKDANSKLIAASPDLLGVLKDIVYTWENFNVNRESQMGEAIQFAKEAINKAGAE